MELSNKQLEELVIDAYKVTYKRAKEAYNKISEMEIGARDQEVFICGKTMGENEAFSQIALLVLGGAKLFELWNELIEESNEE